MLPKGNQIAAARALLGWDQKDVAERVGLTIAAISKIEKGENKGKSTTLDAIQSAFEMAGVVFTDGGVQLRKNAVRIFEGAKGFLEFYDEVYWTVRQSKNKTVYVSNVDERKFVEWQKEQLTEHTQRMQDLDVRYKILIQHGDTYFPASTYADYRWMPKGTFFSVPYYMYGEKLAMMIFEDEPRIYILDEPEISLMHRKQFESLWEQSTEPKSA